MTASTTQSNRKNPWYMRPGLVGVLIVLFVLFCGFSIRPLLRDLAGSRQSLDPHLEFYVSDPFFEDRSLRVEVEPEFKDLEAWPKREEIRESRVYWFRFPVNKLDLQNLGDELFLEMRESNRSWNLRTMSIFLEKGNELKEIGRTGFEIAAEKRPYDELGFVLPIARNEIAEGIDYVFVRTTIRGGFLPQFSLWSDLASLKKFKDRVKGIKLFNTSVYLMVLGILGVLVFLKKKPGMTCFLLAVATWFSISFFLWLAEQGHTLIGTGNVPLILEMVGAALSLFFLLLFSYHLLQFRLRKKIWVRLFLALTYLNFLVLGLMLVATFIEIDVIVRVLWLVRDVVLSLFLITVGLYALFRGVAEAAYYLFAFTLILGVRVFYLFVGYELLSPLPFPIADLPTLESVMALGALLFLVSLVNVKKSLFMKEGVT